MLSPKEQSFVDIIVGIEREASRGNTIVFGWFTGLRTRWIKVRLNLVDVLTRYVRRNGKLWIRIFLTNQ
jgi:ribosomal protein L16/L10AE